MESIYQLGMALGCAAGLVALFGLLRQTFRFPSTPAWFASAPVAYMLAVLLTVGFAGSLYYLGLALTPFLPAGIAFLGTFAIHLGFVAVCLRMLPADEADPRQASAKAEPMNAVTA